MHSFVTTRPATARFVPERAGLVQWQYAGFPSQRREFDSRIPLIPATAIEKTFLGRHGLCLFLISLITLTVFTVSPQRVLAQEKSDAVLTLEVKDSTLQKGITVRSPDTLLTVGIPASVTEGPSLLRVEREKNPPPATKDKTFSSPIWHVSVSGYPAEQASAAPLMLRPLTVVLRPEGTGYFQRRVAVWDATKQRWVPFRTTVRADGSLRAAVKKNDFLVTVLQNTDIVLGKASWFRSRHTDAAASNDFPFGTKLRVVNLENNKSVTVTVRSTGPFVRGRVLDISHTTFKQLAPLGSGVIRSIRVERIS